MNSAVPDKIKLKANGLVRKAIKNGSLAVMPCSVCGGKAVAHHDDYSKPLDVKWLCKKHHHALHHGKKPSYSPAQWSAHLERKQSHRLLSQE